MNFDEVVVKESPGLCRCCLSEGCYKDLGSEYSWMNETEIYADMLLECFDISITQHMDGPNGPNRLICEVCITRLRDACNFKKQVLDSEKKFVDMLARGEFRNKVMVYDSNMKQEPSNVQADALEVEYLDEMDFGDDADPEELLRTDTEAPETTQSDDITVSTLPVKRGRGRPRKNPEVVTPKKKIKVAKVDEKPRSSKAASKEPVRSQMNAMVLRRDVRANLQIILKTTTIIPFKWFANNFNCFFCGVSYTKVDELRHHTRKEHEGFHTDSILKHAIPKNNEVKLDVKDLDCIICSNSFITFDSLVDHLVEEHKQKYVKELHNYFPLYQLKDGKQNCVHCHEEFLTFVRLLKHMSNDHVKGDSVCENCGKTFISDRSLKKHIESEHVRELKYDCRDCNKKFFSKINLRSHMAASHKTMTYDCNVCGNKFSSVYKMKRHLAKDHQKGTYECDKCNEIFFWKMQYFKHKCNSHLMTKVICTICGMKFKDNYLKQHMVSHSDERPFKCEMCQKTFSRKKTLRVHLKTHSQHSRTLAFE